jgi:hypothetical protein
MPRSIKWFDLGTAAAGLLGLSLVATGLFADTKGLWAEAMSMRLISVEAQRVVPIIGFEDGIAFGSVLISELNPHDSEGKKLRLVYVLGPDCRACDTTSSALREVVDSTPNTISRAEIICAGPCGPAGSQLAAALGDAGLDVILRQIVNGDEFRLRTGLRDAPIVLVLNADGDVMAKESGALDESGTSVLREAIAGGGLPAQARSFTGKGSIGF